MNEIIEAKLKKLGIANKSIKVFGVARVRIQVECISKSAANKWASTLSKFCEDVKAIETTFTNKENKSGFLNPTKHSGFRVYATI